MLCNRAVPRRVALDEVAAHNERMWERLASAGIPYTRPVGVPPRSKAGKRRFLDELTDGAIASLPLEGKRVLALAGGGGWDAILLAELGADTTLFDISARQIETVRRIARRRGTALSYVRGDMRDLGSLGDGEFDLVIHKHSIVFVPDAPRVIAEVARVLAPDGVYLFSTMHPVTLRLYESWTGTGWRLKTTYFEDRAIPVTDPTWDFGRVKVRAPTLEYGHRIGDLVNACARAGLLVDGLWEWSPGYDPGPPGSDDDLERQLPAFIRLRARKLASAATGSHPRTAPPAPPAFAPPPGDSRPIRRRTRGR
jgi:2-polyprenyl-3-methyl-5-hydroxy-6-metoxy-1,4-benzoquinol methylase